MELSHWKSWNFSPTEAMTHPYSPPTTLLVTRRWRGRTCRFLKMSANYCSSFFLVGSFSFFSFVPRYTLHRLHCISLSSSKYATIISDDILKAVNSNPVPLGGQRVVPSSGKPERRMGCCCCCCCCSCHLAIVLGTISWKSIGKWNGPTGAALSEWFHLEEGGVRAGGWAGAAAI